MNDNTPSLAEATKEMPRKLLTKLLKLSKKLPEASRASFIRNTARRLADVVTDHPYTIVYSIAGMVVGRILDHVLIIPLPWHHLINLTGDKAWELLFAGGALFGFFEDRKSIHQRHKIVRIIREEFHHAYNTATDI